MLLDFLRRHKANIRHLTGLRYSGELGHPFHVRDRDVAQNLAKGFEGLWRKAMKSLQEVSFDPRRPSADAQGEAQAGKDRDSDRD